MSKQFVECVNCGVEVVEEEARRLDNSDYSYCEECFFNIAAECDHCGGMFHKSTMTDVDGYEFCEDCLDDVATRCDRCGEYVLKEDVLYFQDGYDAYCEDCFDHLAVECDRCGDYVHRDHIHEDDYGVRLCSYCLDSHYYTCVVCGRFVHEYDICTDDDEVYCEGCFNDHCNDRHTVIHKYSYKPIPVFHGNNSPLFMGIELEIDGGGYDHDNAAEIMEPLGDLVYAKYDGSLHWKGDPSGFEVVAHPMTLDYFYDQEGNFKRALKKALSLDYRSHDAGTCGIHVHVSRDYFGGEGAVAKLVYLFERFWPEIKRFSRRTNQQIGQWAQRYSCDSELREYTEVERGELPEKMRKLYDMAKDRARKYCAVNITNCSTIELRIFRGSLKYSTFAATVEFVHLLSTIAKECNLVEVHSMAWSNIVKAASHYRYLPEYLRERGIAEIKPHSKMVSQ